LFINCKATSGGAIYIKGSLNLTDTRFVQNNADNGGAICLDSDSNSLSLTQVCVVGVYPSLMGCT
jgi:predicted outer membrane repeat protein